MRSLKGKGFKRILSVAVILAVLVVSSHFISFLNHLFFPKKLKLTSHFDF